MADFQRPRIRASFAAADCAGETAGGARATALVAGLPAAIGDCIQDICGIYYGVVSRVYYARAVWEWPPSSIETGVTSVDVIIIAFSRGHQWCVFFFVLYHVFSFSAAGLRVSHSASGHAELPLLS